MQMIWISGDCCDIERDFDINTKKKWINLMRRKFFDGFHRIMTKIDFSAYGDLCGSSQMNGLVPIWVAVSVE